MTEKRPVVMITGVSGLIGSALAQRLAPGHVIVGLDIKRGEDLPDSVDFIETDLTDDASVRAAIDQARTRHGDKLASVVHLAAYYDFAGEPSPLYEQLTVRGTERLYRTLLSLDVEQFLFASTLLVHAPCEPGKPINEADPLKPKWAYPQSKVDAEQILHRFGGKIPTVVLRIAGVYDDYCHSIPLAHQIQRVAERRLTSRVFPGRADRGQPFLHLDDLLDAVTKAIAHRAMLPPQTTFLIGEPETLTYEEIQRRLGELLHREEWVTEAVPKPIAKAGAWVQDNLPMGEDPFIKPWMVDIADDHYELDVARARQQLDWHPRHRLGATLSRMVEALLKDPAAWCREHDLEAIDVPVAVARTE